MLHGGLGLVSRTMRWVDEGMGFVWGEQKHIQFLRGNLKERDHSKYL
jgi:hypothetical protein